MAGSWPWTREPATTCHWLVDPFVIGIDGQARRPTIDDVARHTRLGDALPLVEQIHMMDDTIPDLDPHVSELRGIEAFVANTTTAYHCAPGSLEGTRYWIEVAQIMAGGSLTENPILGAYVPSVSPLVLTEFNTQQLRMFLEAGALCNVGPCAIAGASAPYTTAGLLVQSWAEFLAMLVAAQAIAPGCTILGGGGGAHHMDMRSAQSMYSGVTKALASAAMNELAAWLGLPVISGNFTTLCSNFGVQNGVESVFGAFATLGSPVNLFGHMGSMANAVGMSPAQIVIHHDLVETFEQFRRGIDTAPDRLAVESIVAVGAHGSFLEEQLTLDNLRSGEHDFAPTFEVCEGTRDRTTMAEHAHERAEQLMAPHQPAVPADRLEQVRRYVERELAELG